MEAIRHPRDIRLLGKMARDHYQPRRHVVNAGNHRLVEERQLRSCGFHICQLTFEDNDFIKSVYEYIWLAVSVPIRVDKDEPLAQADGGRSPELLLESLAKCQFILLAKALGPAKPVSRNARRARAGMGREEAGDHAMGTRGHSISYSRA